MPRSLGAAGLLALHSQADPVEAGSTQPCRSSRWRLHLGLTRGPSWQLSQAAASRLVPRLCTVGVCWGVPQGSC